MMIDKNSLDLEVCKDLKLLEKIFRMPADMAKLMLVLKRVHQVLELSREINTPESSEKIGKIMGAIDRLQQQQEALEIIYPRSNSNRKSVAKYYDGEGSPHYCVYWHAPASEEIYAQYVALNASLLPVFMHLENKTRNFGKEFSSRNYEFCHAFRMLSKAESREYLVIKSLPTHALPPEALKEILIEKFDEFSIDQSVAGRNKGLAQIFRGLNWYLTDVWNEQSGLRDERNSRGHRKYRGHGGEGLGEIERRVRLFAEDKSFSFERYLEVTQDQDLLSGSNDPLAFIDGPGEDLSEIVTGVIKTFSSKNRKRWASFNAKYTAQAIQNNNQQLLVNRQKLSGYELKVFIDALANLDEKTWKGITPANRQRVAIWCSCRFWLGRTEEWVKSLEIGPADDNVIVLTYDFNAAKFRVPVIYPARSYSAEDSAFSLPAEASFSLIPCSLFQTLLGRYCPSSGKVFPRSLEAMFQELVSNVNEIHGTNLTTKRLELTIPKLIAQLSGERVIRHYFAGLPPEQYAPAVYAAIPEGRFQHHYDNALKHISSESGLEISPGKASKSSPDIFDVIDRHVGSRFVPKLSVARDAVIELRERIVAGSDSGFPEIVELHNAYTAYCAVMLFVSTGTRCLTSVMPLLADFDSESSLAFMSEKDSTDYRNSRWVWIHPMLVAQIREYDLHTIRLRRHLAVMTGSALNSLDARTDIPTLSKHHAPDRKADLAALKNMASRFFVLEPGSNRCLSASGGELELYFGKAWRSKIGTLRHFLRSRLLRDQISDSYCGAEFGHFDSGEEPLGEFSTMNLFHWKISLQHRIDDVMNDLCFSVLRSPLVMV